MSCLALCRSWSEWEIVLVSMCASEVLPISISVIGGSGHRTGLSPFYVVGPCMRTKWLTPKSHRDPTSESLSCRQNKAFQKCFWGHSKAQYFWRCYTGLLEGCPGCHLTVMSSLERAAARKVALVRFMKTLTSSGLAFELKESLKRNSSETVRSFILEMVADNIRSHALEDKWDAFMPLGAFVGSLTRKDQTALIYVMGSLEVRHFSKSFLRWEIVRNQ